MRGGDTVDLGTASLSEDEIRAFTENFDPQPQYVDESVSKPLHDGLVASPWHTTVIANRLLVDGLINHIADLGHFEIGEIKAPLRLKADQTIRAEACVREVADAPEADDRGAVIVDVELFDPSDRLVGGFATRLLVARRPRF